MSFGIVRRLDTDFPEFLTSHHASLRCVACGRAYNAYSNTEKSCCKHTHGIVIANVGEQTVYAYKYVPKPKFVCVCKCGCTQEWATMCTHVVCLCMCSQVCASLAS